MISEHVTRSAEETVGLGSAFGARLRKGDVVGLNGTLGSGKTQFVKGVCAAFHVRTEVLSPSFVIMHRYEGEDASGDETIIHHFDFYRLRRDEELDDIGFRDLVGADAISLVEWADAFPGSMPQRTLNVTFEHGDDEHLRTVRLPFSLSESA